MLPILEPWPRPTPPAVRILLTARGQGSAPYGAGNLAMHVGDDPGAVAARRAWLTAQTGTAHCQYLDQVHSATVVPVTAPLAPPPRADGLYTRRRGLALAVLTADCVPVVLWSARGDELAVVHAGWRGLCAGILPAAVARFGCGPAAVSAYIGACIGPEHYEIDAAPRAALAAHLGATAEPCLAATRPGHWRLDLRAAARASLAGAGVTAVAGGGFCTFADAEWFYSYRREGVTGRQATLAWLS